MYDSEFRGACRGTELRCSYIRRGKFEMESMLENELLRPRRGLATTGSIILSPELSAADVA